MSAAKKIEPPTPRERLRYHMTKLAEGLDMPEHFLPLLVHDVEQALKAWREMEREER